MKRLSELLEKKPAYAWLFFGGAMLITFLFGLFASTVAERRIESVVSFQIANNIDEHEADNSVWGKSYPRQYQRWKATEGSAVKDLLDVHPEMPVLWAGYAFSREYNEARGHMNAVRDVREILRTGVAQPGTCWTCKSSNVPGLMAKIGTKEFYRRKWVELGHDVKHPIGCVDCHNPKTMELRISRPALTQALEREGRNIAEISHQEMRSLVCAQCHVEYHFKDKKDPELIFPWHKGTRAEQIEEHYDEIDFFDWEHPLSRTKMLKAQHPDYELSKEGIHFQRGVSCADCHMPYWTEGGVKFTDHKIESPLNKISYSCAVCHTENEEQLRKNVYDRQDIINQLRKQAQKLLARTHIEAKKAWEKGATQAEIAPALKLIRQAQWRWDFAVASLGASFHAPLEVARLLGTAMEKAQEARLEIARVLARRGHLDLVDMPDITTKQKAQKFIGLDMNKITADKKEFIKKAVPAWDANKKLQQKDVNF